MNKIVKAFIFVVFASILGLTGMNFGLTGMQGPFVLDADSFKMEINTHFRSNPEICRILNEFCDKIYELSTTSNISEYQIDSLIEATSKRVLENIKDERSLSLVQSFLNNPKSYTWHNLSIGKEGATLYHRPPRWAHRAIWVSSVLCGLFILYSQVVLGTNPFSKFFYNPNATSHT